MSQGLSEFSRRAFDGYLAQIARLNGVSSAERQFTVAPSIQQKLESVIQESSAFLTSVNSYPADQISGEKIGLSMGSTIASRTDTTVSDREPVDPTALNDNQYKCEKTNFDTALRYAKIDLWAKFPDFQTRISNGIAQQIGRDRLMIGWNGTSAAANTDRAADPLLQDVNIGWLKKLQTNAPARYMFEGANDNEIRVGAGGDYANIDELVYDMRASLLEPWHARDDTFVACCSGDLLDDKYIPMVAAHGGTPTEVLALDMMLRAKKLGGLHPASIPFFPARSIFVTLLGQSGGSNLSIYWQTGTRRHTFIDNAKRDRYELYQSVNEAYEIEDYGAACAAVNIKFPNGAGGWA